MDTVRALLEGAAKVNSIPDGEEREREALKLIFTAILLGTVSNDQAHKDQISQGVEELEDAAQGIRHPSQYPGQPLGKNKQRLNQMMKDVAREWEERTK